MTVRRTIGRAPALLALALAVPVHGALPPSAADRAIATAEERVTRAPSADAWVALAAGFMQKARATGDPSHYERAGAAVERAERLDPESYAALRTRAWVLLGMHRFGAALRVARTARRRAPTDWWNYGNIADACTELGRYDCALRATSRMMALRPGVPAYVRVAALRALFGDRRGAIDALDLALAAADPADADERAWLLTHLGHEHRALGRTVQATAAYEAALATVPDHHLALPGLARVRALGGRTAEAIALYERTLELAPSPAVAGALGDLYAASGDPMRARATYALVEQMGRVARSHGGSLGRDLALFLAEHERDLDEALALARADAAVRDDVYTADTLAWTLFKRGELAAAKRASTRALRLGTEDASFHRHAAAIASALGRRRVAERHAARARSLGDTA